MSSDPLPMTVGLRVYKIAGYRFEGTVVAAFRTLAGAVRFVVDNGDGLLHIFNPEQLAPQPKDPSQ